METPDTNLGGVPITASDLYESLDATYDIEGIRELVEGEDEDCSPNIILDAEMNEIE